MKSVLNKLLSTNNGKGNLILRLCLGVMILPHGLQKAFGLFGGDGFAATMDAFTNGMGVPWIFAFLAIAAEFLGGVGLVLGFCTRLAALGVGGVMVVAATMHLEHGFFMNWMGTQQGEGIEFFILAVGMAIAIVINGGGAFSVDRFLRGFFEE